MEYTSTRYEAHNSHRGRSKHLANNSRSIKESSPFLKKNRNDESFNLKVHTYSCVLPLIDYRLTADNIGQCNTTDTGDSAAAAGLSVESPVRY